MVETEILDEKIAKILEAIWASEISSMKSVISGIVRVINDPNSTAKDLKEIILVDPPLSGKILKVANSSFYGPQSKIDEIEKAIIWMGYSTVKELALRQKTCQIFDKNDSIEGYRRSELWTYCVSTAMFAKMIYRREFSDRGEVIYAAGLLHKIGLIAEEQFLRKAFTKILKINNAQKEPNLPALERKVFGFDHAVLGMHVAQLWMLPVEMEAAIGFHLDPYQAGEEYFRISATLHIAGVLSRFAQLGYSDASPFNDALYRRCLTDLGIEQESLNLIIEEGQLEIAEMMEKGAL